TNLDEFIFSDSIICDKFECNKFGIFKDNNFSWIVYCNEHKTPLSNEIINGYEEQECIFNNDKFPKKYYDDLKTSNLKIDMDKRICIVDNCKTIASFGYKRFKMK